jgi:hypothetical protein
MNKGAELGQLTLENILLLLSDLVDPLKGQKHEISSLFSYTWEPGTRTKIPVGKTSTDNTSF